MKEGEISSSFYSWESDFYKVMKRRVVKRLAQRGLSRRGSYEIWIKAVVILTGFWVSLFRMYVASTFLTAAMWSASMGIFAAFVGTCIQHDGNHGAFANGRLPNKVAGWTLDMIGASAFTWEFQHMLGHHPYTNLLDSDEEKRKETGVDCPMVEKDQVWIQKVKNLTLSSLLITGLKKRCNFFSFPPLPLLVPYLLFIPIISHRNLIRMSSPPSLQ